MKNIINTDNADFGFTDITGVKTDTSNVVPEQLKVESRHAADDGKYSGESSAKQKNAVNGGVELKKTEQSDKVATEDGSMGNTKSVQSDKVVAEDGSIVFMKVTQSNKAVAGNSRVDKTKSAQSEKAIAEEAGVVSSTEVRKCVNSVSKCSEAEKEDEEFLALIKGKYRDAYRRRTEGIIRRRLKSAKSKPDAVNKSSPLTEAQSSECTHGSASYIGELAFNTENGVDNENVNMSFSNTATIGTVIGKTANLGRFDCDNDANTSGGRALYHYNGLNHTPVVEISTESSYVAQEKTLELEKKNGILVQKNANRNRPRENGVGGSVGMVTGINVSALKGSEILELLRRAETGEKIRFK